MERGHFRVVGEDPQVMPPLTCGSVVVKGERRMVAVPITNQELLVQSNHVHVRGGGGGRRTLVVG